MSCGYNFRSFSAQKALILHSEMHVQHIGLIIPKLLVLERKICSNNQGETVAREYECFRRFFFFDLEGFLDDGLPRLRDGLPSSEESH